MSFRFYYTQDHFENPNPKETLSRYIFYGKQTLTNLSIDRWRIEYSLLCFAINILKYSEQIGSKTNEMNLLWPVYKSYSNRNSLMQYSFGNLLVSRISLWNSGSRSWIIRTLFLMTKGIIKLSECWKYGLLFR